MTTYDVSQASIATAPPTVPVCVACGNRRTFLLNTPHQILHLAIEQVIELKSLDQVICGRCGSHHATILEYEA